MPVADARRHRTWFPIEFSGFASAPWERGSSSCHPRVIGNKTKNPWSGGTFGRWEASGGLLTLTFTGSDIVVTVGPITASSPGIPTESVDAPYTCGATTVEFDPPDTPRGLWPLPKNWTKVGRRLLPLATAWRCSPKPTTAPTDKHNSIDEHGYDEAEASGRGTPFETATTQLIVSVR